MSRNLFIIVLLIITPFCGWGQVDTIADQKLQEVVIMAKLPTVEMKPGKMTYSWMPLSPKAKGMSTTC